MDSGLDTAPCLYFSFSENGEMTDANALFCEIIRRPKTEIVGIPFDKFLAVSSRIALHTNWKPMLHLQGFVNELRINLVDANGTQIPVVLNLQIRKNTDRYMVDCAGIAIPGRKRAEDELVAAKKAYEAALSANVALSNARTEIERQVEELNKTYSLTKRQNIELNQINKIVTHDLQEPIRKMLFNAEQLGALSAGLPPEIAKILQRISRQTDNLRLKLKGLQEYIWLTEIDRPFVTVDLNKALAEAFSKIVDQFGQGRIHLKAVNLPLISGDKAMLSALFYHVIENAVIFTEPDTVVKVDIRCLELSQNSLQNLEGHYHYKNYIRIDISDDGPGIDAGHAEKIFDLFYRSENSPGIGSGLALSKKIVEQHDGNITATSSVGKGLQISILLPVSLNKIQ